MIQEVPDAQVLADLDASLDWAVTQGANKDRVGVTSFCWGGRVTWLYGAHQPAVKAAVAWYGRLVGDHSTLQPQQPIDVAARLKAPVLGLYGGVGPGIPLDTVERMQAALTKVGSLSEFHVYPEAPHAFFADDRPSYRRREAEGGFQRLQRWFKKYAV